MKPKKSLRRRVEIDYYLYLLSAPYHQERKWLYRRHFPVAGLQEEIQIQREEWL